MLHIKRGTAKQPLTDLGFAYGHLTEVVSDAFGQQLVKLTFVLPMSAGPTIVLLRGEGVGPLLEGILSNTVKSVEIFDPDRHLPTKKGDWDTKAYKWAGPCVIKHISVNTVNSPDENISKH